MFRPQVGSRTIVASTIWLVSVTKSLDQIFNLLFYQSGIYMTTVELDWISKCGSVVAAYEQVMFLTIRLTIPKSDEYAVRPPRRYNEY
jgi:hypothetical protein